MCTVCCSPKGALGQHAGVDSTGSTALTTKTQVSRQYRTLLMSCSGVSSGPQMIGAVMDRGHDSQCWAIMVYTLVAIDQELGLHPFVTCMWHSSQHTTDRSVSFYSEGVLEVAVEQTFLTQQRHLPIITMCSYVPHARHS